MSINQVLDNQMLRNQKNNKMKLEKLKIDNVSVQIDNKKIIENISIELYEGEIVSILGVSGVGKTTLFNVISGLVLPTGSGKVYKNNIDITGKSGEISYMLQKDLLLPFKKVIDNVSLPLVIRGEKKKKAREIVRPYFEDFGLEGTENKYPNQLSGGMKQRAALLRTYMFSNEIALLDEPFSALDMITKHKMHSWYLNIMKKLKMSTLFITHDIDEAILLSNRIYLLSGSPGKIIKELDINLNFERSNFEKNSSFSSKIFEMNSEEIMLSEKFISYKREILKYLQ